MDDSDHLGILCFPMMPRQPLAHRREPSPQVRRLLHGHMLAPGDEVPAHFVEAAGLEADRYCAVFVLLDGLVRVEEEGCGVGGGAGVEAERDFDRLLLEGAEGAPGEGSQVEGGVGLEILEAEPRGAYVGQAPEARLAAPVGPRHEEGRLP